jgi:hypothetical protein
MALPRRTSAQGDAARAGVRRALFDIRDTIDNSKPPRAGEMIPLNPRMGRRGRHADYPRGLLSAGTCCSSPVQRRPRPAPRRRAAPLVAAGELAYLPGWSRCRASAAIDVKLSPGEAAAEACQLPGPALLDLLSGLRRCRRLSGCTHAVSRCGHRVAGGAAGPGVRSEEMRTPGLDRSWLSSAAVEDRPRSLPADDERDGDHDPWRSAKLRGGAGGGDERW